ncbi:MAG TPA: response regulator [Cyanobacteria bacterium UBA8803]|nr:response regulator [Cyanobacteria bacterium UBA9273]HBL61706.1 response regulator [Cyanobacteria bacterium UBA8803]
MTQILIAEDETRLAAFIEKGLRKQGFTTAIAQDGQQAINIARDGDFDLMLLDLGLPIVDGWAVLKELRSQGETRPIIIVTALKDNRDKATALSMGANDYLTKPFHFSDLLERVCTQLEAARTQTKS